MQNWQVTEKMVINQQVYYEEINPYKREVKFIFDKLPRASIKSCLNLTTSDISWSVFIVSGQLHEKVVDF